MTLGISFKEGAKAKNLAREIKRYIVNAGGQVVEGRDFSGADYIFTLGGDGTLIHKACEYIELGVPLVGINTGRLGFLTAVESQDWKIAVDAVLSGKVIVSERMSLEITTPKERFRAVNEAVIKGLYRVVELGVRVGGAEFFRVLGDGVIVGTQTGSTAYSLSAGGPIVDSDLNSILITPINPIGLPIPSVVLSADEVIRVEVIKGDDVSLIIDGQEHTKVGEGAEIKLIRGKHNVKFGYLSKHQFLKSLNLKFGLSSRNFK